MMRSIQYNEKLIAQLQLELTKVLPEGVDFSDSGRALYTSDASNYRQIPLGITYPRNVEDIRRITAVCYRLQVPLLMRGAGTSQNGQCVNVAVIIDCSRHLNKVLKVSPSTRSAWVEPGVICDDLKATAALSGLTFGPDPGTHSRCTLGGMIGNNSCGPHSMQAGKTVENIEELEILTYDGAQFWVGPTSEDELENIIAKGDRKAEIYAQLKAIRDQYCDRIREKYPNIKRRVSGYNLDQLLPENNFNVARALVGSEGTCVSILQAKTRLIEAPKHVQTLILGFTDIYLAGDTVPAILPFKPIAMEGLDWGIVGGLTQRNLKQQEIALLPEGRAWLVIELAAQTPQQLQQHCDNFGSAMQQQSDVVACKLIDKHQAKQVWSIRELGASATALSDDPNEADPVVGWEDTAVDPHQLGNYLREFQALIDKFNYKTSLYGHFGDGCIHARITFDTRSVEGISQWREFSEQVAKLVIKYGGSLSGEHGDGQAKAEFLPLMYGSELMTAFERFKAVWDSTNKMNPGKLIHAYRMDENLRYGPDYRIPATQTFFSFSDDNNKISRALERCVGMGKCRSYTTPMCPSFQATSQERFSTRGRAHLLHEMLRGEVIKDGWDNQEIAHSMEHCLSCKACKSDCPTQVDVATYKAEFMAQHFKNNKRPLNHYVFGGIGRYLPLLSKAPRVVNKLVSNSLVKKVISKSLDIVEHHNLPILDHQPFSDWAQLNAYQSTKDFYWFGDDSNPPVVLWIDSFNGYYRSKVLKSAVRALLSVNYKVAIARRRFCCGRPLYEHGFLDQAKKQLNEILDDFLPKLPTQAKVIVIEPSCLSVFKDELINLLSSDQRAHELSQRMIGLIDFLCEAGIRPQRKLKKAILHLHCHHKSKPTEDQDNAWLTDCFEELIEPESGCCGMAGSFGIKKQTHEIANHLYQRKLGPAIDNADDDSILITNGFSCREQIESHSTKATLHPVEIVELCLLSDDESKFISTPIFNLKKG